MEQIEREAMEFDVVIVGGGPAGLSAAIKLRQLAIEKGMPELSVCVIEKGSELGAHILSGAILEPRALNELIPDWKAQGAPVTVPCKEDRVYMLLTQEKSVQIPNNLVPLTLHNEGNYIISLGNLVRWLGTKAEELEVTVFPGFSGSDILYNEDGSVRGIRTGDMGVDKNGVPKAAYQPGYDLIAKYTLFSEGCRGHLGKRLMSRFNLNKEADPQHYGIGIKELWEIDPSKHEEGLVLHGSGWPLTESGSTGGWWMYHGEGNLVSLGLIIDLSYKNPYVSTFDEMQRWKLNPLVRQYLEGGKRLSYGARALVKGGLESLPKCSFPGGLLIGDDAGFLNNGKLKGSHTAMKSGMIAAETVFDAIKAGHTQTELTQFEENFKKSWLYEELYETRNFGSALHRMGTLAGGGYNWLEENILKGRVKHTIHDNVPDFKCLQLAKYYSKIDYPKPDGKITFDKLSSVFMSNTNHEENQVIHLQLRDALIPVDNNLPLYDEPAQRYCPAGVYEVIQKGDEVIFQINSQNCVHCKTCDIKDPLQNITWVVPEGGGGPNYPNM